ncbi:MAG: FmdB family transcriptional regulator [Acidobacteria bacterium]|nr:MAG: FmdB family transcriptional regulator [Acidobacteriota bacterium]
MPTYEYRCADCGEHIEVVQSFNDDPLTTCGLCQGELKKVFHPVGVVFKGSGFYVNDSRSSKAQTTSTKSESAGSETKSTDSSKASADSSKGDKSEKSESKSSSADTAKSA